MVRVGSTSDKVARVTNAARAGPAPSMRNDCSPCARAPSSTEMPTTPLTMIITAAKMVSRASPALSGPPASMTLMISATSITVMATASTRVPKGSPTRWATTSAWCTEAITVPISAIAQAATSSAPDGIVNMVARRPAAAVGNSQDQSGMWTLGGGLGCRPSERDGATGGLDIAGQGRAR